MKKLLLIALLSISALAICQKKTFVKDYTYTAGEADSKLTSRAIALEQVKRYLLEELGVYIVSTFDTKIIETKDGFKELTKQDIRSISAGITETKMLEENWTGALYYIKAELTVDIGEFKKTMNKIANDEAKAKQFAELQEKSDAAFADISKLQQELNDVKTENEKIKLHQQYLLTTNSLTATDWYQKATNAYEIKEYDNTILYCQKAIELNPSHEWSHISMGVAYHDKGNETKAMICYERVVALNPQNDVAYNDMGVSIAALGDNDKAIEFYNKAIAIRPADNLYKRNVAISYNVRGVEFFKLKNYPKAIEAFTLAAKNDTTNATYHFNLGLAVYNNGEYDSAVKYLNHAINLKSDYTADATPTLADAYANLGLASYRKGDTKHQKYYYKESAIRGGKESRDWLLKNGYTIEISSVFPDCLNELKNGSALIFKKLPPAPGVYEFLVPEEKGYAYAVGISDAAARTDDAVEQADERAREYLSLSLGIELSSITKRFEAEVGGKNMSQNTSVVRAVCNKIIAKSSVEILDHYTINDATVITLARTNLNSVHLMTHGKGVVIKSFEEITDGEMLAQLDYGAKLGPSNSYYASCLRSGTEANEKISIVRTRNAEGDSSEICRKKGKYVVMYAPEPLEHAIERNVTVGLLPYSYLQAISQTLLSISQKEDIYQKRNVPKDSVWMYTFPKNKIFGFTIKKIKLDYTVEKLNVAIEADYRRDSLAYVIVSQDGNWKSYLSRK